MMNSRKQLIARIAIQEKKLHYQQSQLIKHEEYFTGVIRDYKFPFFLIILPAFFLGWKSGRKNWINSGFKQLTNIGVVAAATYFKKQLMYIINK